MSVKFIAALFVLSLASHTNAQSELSVTATNNLNFVYVDGVQMTPLPNNGTWQNKDTVEIDNYARVIAIRANNVLGGCSGILATIENSPFDYNFVSDAQWKCFDSAPSGWEQPGFDDSAWEDATQVARNGEIVSGCPWIPINDMPPVSYWVWTTDWRDGDMVVSCRGYPPICDQNPCVNGGTCTPNGVNLCACPPHYGGQFCEMDVNVCDSNPCQNGGMCSITEDGYQCECQVGYTGVNCETDTTDCASMPCQNGGTCNFIIDGGYACSCLPGFSGVNCETDVDECESDPCQHGSTCVDIPNGVVCDCSPGYTGDFCQIDINECASTPCMHAGQCMDEVNGYTCNCQSGWTGVHCETPVGDCASAPCMNGGTCTLNGPDGAVECICPPGFSGDLCQNNDDECASAPCLHGGTCSDAEGTFNCTCTPMYDGTRCENIKPNCGSIMSMSAYPPVRNFWTLCEINILDHPNYVNMPCNELITGITYYNDSSTIIGLGGTFGCFATKFPDEMPDSACVPNYNNGGTLGSCLSCTHMGVCIDVPPPPE